MFRNPVHGRAHLVLAIVMETPKGKVTTTYMLRYLHPYPEAVPAWRLTKEDASSWDVHLSEHGPMCTCPDFVYARDHQDDKGCKHIAALRSVGLLRKT